jgi:hypothetical protein
MVKVLYLAGWGRSGTTILDNILDSYESVFSVGELYYLWRRGLVSGRHCGCGQKVSRCPLWRKILQVAYGSDQPDPRTVADLQQQVARVRHARRLTTRPLPPAAAEYRDLLGRLYPAIAEVTGAELIVESSKLPSGAAVLARIPGIEPYLVQMVRDPRAVAHSWMRPKQHLDRPKPRPMRQHGPAESTLSWLSWNWLTEQVARSYPGRWRRLRYESFTADPRAAAEDLLRFTGLVPTGGPFRDRQTVQLAGNHTVSGNPSRFQTGLVVLRDDDAWRRDQPIGSRLVSTTLALPLLHRYGYRIRTSRGRPD